MRSSINVRYLVSLTAHAGNISKQFRENNFMQPILFFAAAFFSELIGTSIGFCSSTVFLPLALFFLDFPSALAITAVFHLFGNLGRLTFFRKNLDWKILKTFGSASVLATIAGALLVSYAPQNFLKFLLGIF